VTLYIKDIGDGKTTLDQLAYEAGVTCTDVPSPPGDANGTGFLTLDSGDFKGQVKGH
jgi:hypothetical protein